MNGKKKGYSVISNVVRNPDFSPLARNDDKKDIFNTKWVIIGVVVASLVMPLLSSCGNKGNLKRPTPTTTEHPDPTVGK